MAVTADTASPKPTWADTAYATLAPAVFAGVRLGARWLGASPGELRERAGELPDAPRPLLWFHGASAGEMNAAAALVRALRAAGFDFSSGYTATNQAGIAVARAVAQPRDRAALAPWDSPGWVARALDRWCPSALFLIETELWPRLVLDAVRRGIPVFSASARLYPRDEARYRLVRPFIAPTLARLSMVLAQNEDERARFLRLGAREDRCVVAGDLKHAAPPAAVATAARLRADLQVPAGEPIVTCGSMHADEMELLAAALERIDPARPRCIIAPRHAQALPALAAACRARGWRTHRRSAGAAPANWQVLLWDTYGELPLAYAIATVAIVGGSFAPHGGHNLAEPICAGVPVLFGPHTEHCAVARALTARAPDACVRAAEELARRLSQWLRESERRAAVLTQQRAALPDGEGIANHYVAVLSPWLREVGLEGT